MTPFTPAPPPDPLPGMTVAGAQDVLRASLARRRHELAYEALRRAYGDPGAKNGEILRLTEPAKTAKTFPDE